MLLNFYHHFLCFLQKNVNLNLTKIYGVHLMWQKIQIILRPILKFIFFYHLNWISPNRINKISRKRKKPKRFRVGPCRVYHMLVQLAGYMKEADQRQYINVLKLRFRLSFRLTNSLATSASHTASVFVLWVIKIAPLLNLCWVILARSLVLILRVTEN